MGFDLHLVPAWAITAGTEEEWNLYFECEPEGEKLGGAAYVGAIIDLAARYVAHGEKPGSIEMFWRLHSEDRPFWKATEISVLARELAFIRATLNSVPINMTTLLYDSDVEVAQRTADFKKSHPDRPLASLADLFYYFFDSFQLMIDRAIAEKSGLVATY